MFDYPDAPGRECPEAFFAAAVAPMTPDEEFRYFVLELSERGSPDVPIGVLCEWYAGGARANHDLYLPATARAFFDAIEGELRRERQRREAGLVASKTKSWNPSAGEKFEDDWDYVPTYRLQHCLYAFTLIPNVAATSSTALASSVMKGDLLKELWQKAGQLALESGAAAIIPPDGLSAEIVTVSERRCILIKMPEPIGPPAI